MEVKEFIDEIGLEKEYRIFDWEYYVDYYNDAVQNYIPDKVSAWKHWRKSKNEKIFFTKNIKLEPTYETFDWISYISINEDLCNFNRKLAWEHWIICGSKEYRGFQRHNNTCIHKARFGNLFFVNMAFHFIAIKNNLKVTYKYYHQFSELGINFFIGGKSYKENIVLSDSNFFEIIKSESKIEKNILINVNHFFCQKKEFIIFIKDKFEKVFKENIKKKNKFKERYKKNNDIFLHVRLGDLTGELESEKNRKYYDNILSSFVFEKAYISSDSIESNLCQSLIKKFDLEVLNLNEVETIMFASTCKILILSGGTFSWLIGFLAFFSEKIFYPKHEKPWYADIFIFENWTPVYL